MLICTCGKQLFKAGIFFTAKTQGRKGFGNVHRL